MIPRRVSMERTEMSAAGANGKNGLAARGTLAVAFVLAGSAAALAGVTMLIEEVAAPDSTPPGTSPGVVYDQPGAPVLNADHQVAFRSLLAGSGVTSSNNRGIWGEGGGPLALVARAGAAAAGAGSAVFSDFSYPVLAPVSGGLAPLAFYATLTGSGVTGDNNRGLWASLAGTLALIARGGQVPVGGGGAAWYAFGNPAINAAGAMAFRGFLTTNSRDSGIWVRSEAGVMTLLARWEDPAPGTPAGTLFTYFYDPRIGEEGEVTFSASLVGDGTIIVDASNDTGIWSDAGGSLQLVLRSGTPAPGTPPGVDFFTIGEPAVNSAGQMAFRGNLIGPGITAVNKDGIWSNAAGSWQLVARTADPAPQMPAGVVFAELGRVFQNSVGGVAYRGTVAGPGTNESNDRGVWAHQGGSARLVAQAGQQAPGADPGVVFAGHFSEPVMNRTGRLAFFADLAGPGVDPTNNAGIWLEDPTGQLLLVVRRGQTLGSRVVDGVWLSDLSESQGDGLTQTFNDRGQITFALSFADGSDGVYAARAVLPGDLDGDGDVDLSDFTIFQLCFGGSNNPPAATCPPGVSADLDDDGDVDLADFLIFQQNFTGSL